MQYFVYFLVKKILFIVKKSQKMQQNRLVNIKQKTNEKLCDLHKNAIYSNKYKKYSNKLVESQREKIILVVIRVDIFYVIKK